MKAIPLGRARPHGDIDPLGALFVSYRQSDGAPLAHRLAWTLRTFGLPIWQDTADLLPGDTRGRLREALDSGLSGAVLLVTPELRRSQVIRRLEAPGLLRLHRSYAAFSFAVANTITDEHGGIDRTAPDRLLWPIRSRWPALPANRLAHLLQHPLTDHADRLRLARALARRRMEALAEPGTKTVDLHVQTRREGSARVRPSGLVVRTRPPEPGHRLPPDDVWKPLAGLLADLPLLVESAGADHVRVLGGAHLSVAYALGAALPCTAGVRLSVVASSGTWSLPIRAAGGLDVLMKSLSGRGPIAVLVDVADTRQPIDTFGRHVREHAHELAGSLTLRHIGRLDPRQGAALARAAADHIRDVASSCGTRNLSLFLRTPFPLAVLLGQALNTLHVTLYEWDDTCTPPAYQPTLTLSSGRGGGPVAAVHRGGQSAMR